MRDVDLIDPSKLLLSNEVDGQTYFAELHCFNRAFASRLYERIKPIVGRPKKKWGNWTYNGRI